MIDDNLQPDDSLASLLRSAAPTAFEPGFAERVMARARAEREAPLASALESQFRRVVPLLAEASLLLALYNWWGGRNTAGSAIDAALNLPRVSIASAYSSSSSLLETAIAEPEMP